MINDLYIVGDQSRLVVKNIINLLRDNYDTNWVIYGKEQTRESYENFISLVYTLELLNERNRKLYNLYNRKLSYLYKNY